MDVITTHLNADFDALASMVAAKKIYPDAALVFPGSQEKAVRDFLSSCDMKLDIEKIKDFDLLKIDRLIFVDVKSPERIGRFSEVLNNIKIKVHVYDHHPLNDDDIRGEKEVVETVGATVTIFTEMLQKEKIKITHAEATLFMLGIYEETGSLLFQSTTVRDLSAAAYLLKKGANLNIVSTYLSREMVPEQIDLLNELIHSAKQHVIHDTRIKVAMASRETYIGDIASLAHKIAEIEDIDAIFLLVMMEDRVQVIARSHIPEVDVSEILHSFGGGGHPYASSAVVRNMSLEETGNKLLKTLKRKIHPSKTAKDIMTSPVKSILFSRTLKTAEKNMTKYEVNVLPVLKQNSLYGLLSREVVEKALFHGFGKSKVEEFSTTDVPIVHPSTSISVIEMQMIEKNQRFMPVIENDRIVGAITRTDLLRSMYESLLRKNRIGTEKNLAGKPSVGKNLVSLLRSKFPPEIFNLLELSGNIAKALGFTAYLVGGSVRDLLHGESNLDIDIVIEGDGIKFAQELGKELNVKVKSHTRFGTAVVITDFLKFDVATSRTEYYESPAALPTVETSSIKKDLYRRDFTINTLAVSLDPGHFGKLIDFFGGQRDIKEKTLRILHNLSFIEDPTRAFRAIRFSERFGFKISKHTIKLIKTAVRINLFDKLSGSRMYDELNLLFIETEPVNAVKRLAELDLLKFIHKNLTLTRNLEEAFVAIQETFAWFKLLFIEEELNKSHLFLMAILDELALPERDEALTRLQVPKKTIDEILGGLKKAKKALLKLHGASQKQIYYVLRPLDLLTVLFAMAKAKDKDLKKSISLYLTTLRKIKPGITGEDLISMGYPPGPLYKEILSAVLEGRLDGKIKDREDEIGFIKDKFRV